MTPCGPNFLKNTPLKLQDIRLEVTARSSQFCSENRRKPDPFFRGCPHLFRTLVGGCRQRSLKFEAGGSLLPIQFYQNIRKLRIVYPIGPGATGADEIRRPTEGLWAKTTFEETPGRHGLLFSGPESPSNSSAVRSRYSTGMVTMSWSQ